MSLFPADLGLLTQLVLVGVFERAAVDLQRGSLRVREDAVFDAQVVFERDRLRIDARMKGDWMIPQSGSSSLAATESFEDEPVPV